MKRKYIKLLKIVLIVVSFFSASYIYVSALVEDSPKVGYVVNYNDACSEATIIFNFDAVADEKYDILSIKDNNGNELNIKNPTFTTNENGTYSFHVSYQVKESINDVTTNKIDETVINNEDDMQAKELVLDVKVMDIKEVVKEDKSRVIAPLTAIDTSKIYVSSTGDNAGLGTQASPVKTLNRAQELMSDGGTIYVMNDINMASKLSVSKNMTITSIDATKPVTIKRTSSYRMIESFYNYTINLNNVILDGGAIYSTNSTDVGYDPILKRSTKNTGLTTDISCIGYTNGNVNLVGSTIQNAEVTSNDNSASMNAAGICVNGTNANFSMDSKSTIKNCQQLGLDGAGIIIMNSKNVTMQGTFTGCMANRNGGVIRDYSTSPVSYENCNFHNNVVAGKGGALCIDNSTNQLKKISNCTFTENSATQTGGAIYTNTDMTVSGKVIIKDNTNTKMADNLVLASGKELKVDGLTSDSEIRLDNNTTPVVEAKIGTLVNGQNLDRIISNVDDNFYGAEGTNNSIVWKAKILDTVYVSNSGNDTTGFGTQASPVASLDKAQEMLKDGGTIYVMNTIDMSKTFTLTKDMMITSSDPTKPATIKRTVGLGTGMMISGVSKNITLQDIILDGGAIFSTDSKDASYNTTLQRSTKNTGLKGDKTISLDQGTLNLNKGVIIQNAESTTESGGAGIHIMAANLNMDKSVIMKNCQHSNSWGGAIYCEGNVTTPYTVNIAGEFTGCSALNNGGAVVVRASGTPPVTTISNANFHNNKAEGIGSALYLLNIPNATIKDTSIINNAVKTKGNGALYSDNDVTIGNKVVIKDNKETTTNTGDNLVLVSGKLIKADGLTSNSEVYIYVKTPVVGDKIGTVVSGGNLDRIISTVDTNYIGEKSTTNNDIVWGLKDIPLPSTTLTNVVDKEIYSLEVGKPTSIHKDLSFNVTGNEKNPTHGETVVAGYVDTNEKEDTTWVTSNVVPTDGLSMTITNDKATISNALIDGSKQYYVHIKNNVRGVYSTPIDVNAALLKQTTKRSSTGDSITISMELDDTLKMIGKDMSTISGIEQVAYALTSTTNALNGTFTSGEGFYGVQKYTGLKTNVGYDLVIDQETRAKILETGTEVVYMYIKDVVGNIVEIPVSVSEVLLDVEVPTNVSVFALTGSTDGMIAPNIQVKNHGTTDANVSIDSIVMDGASSLKMVDDKASYNNDELSLSIVPVKNLTFTKMNILHVKDMLLGRLSTKTKEGYFTFEGQHSENIQQTLESKFVMKYSFTTTK